MNDEERHAMWMNALLFGTPIPEEEKLTLEEFTEAMTNLSIAITEATPTAEEFTQAFMTPADL